MMTALLFGVHILPVIFGDSETRLRGLVRIPDGLSDLSFEGGGLAPMSRMLRSFMGQRPNFTRMVDLESPALGLSAYRTT